VFPVLFPTFCIGRLIQHPLDVRKVIGSSPISSTKKETTPFGVVFLFALAANMGLEPISMRQSGGLSLPPVQKLVTTLIYSSPISSTIEKKSEPHGSGFFFVKRATACSGSGHRFESYIVHQKGNHTVRCGFSFCFGSKYGTRTHLNATVRWTVAATSSKTGGCLNVIESYIVHHRKEIRTAWFGFFLCQAGNRLQWVRP